MRAVVLKRANVADTDVVAAIEKVCFADFYSMSQIATDLKNDSQYYIYIATINDVVVGYASYSVVTDEAELIRIAVLPDHRGSGVGAEILTKSYNYISELAKSLFLEVSDANISAIKLYTSFGFREISRRKRYYSDDSDAIIMEYKG